MWQKRVGWALFCTSIFVSGCGNSGPSPAPAASSAPSPASLPWQVVLVDDLPNPFEPLPPNAPVGIATFPETVVTRMNGPEPEIDTRPYVRLVIQPGETPAQMWKRAEPWFSAIKLPPGDRLMLEDVVEVDEKTRAREVVGVRTHVVTDRVALTRNDVATAQLIEEKTPPPTLGAPPGTVPERPDPMVRILLKPEGATKLAAFTRDNVYRRIAVTLGDRVLMVARIQQEISGGEISFSMSGEQSYSQKVEDAKRFLSALPTK